MILSIFFACKSPKQTSNKIELDKISRLKKLSTYIIKQEDKTYTLDYSKIELPIGYDTIVWIIANEKWSGKDSTHNKNYTYRKMLDSLLIYKGENVINYQEIIKYYGAPTSFATNKGKYVTGLIYRFNPFNNPKCAKIKHGRLDTTGCGVLFFEINQNGDLGKINSILLYP